jgi:hypothetical protein
MRVEQALEGVYSSLANGNEDIDARIAELKTALQDEGRKQAIVDPSRLAQNNRSGRKMMQSYFKRRGVTIKFQGE